MMQQTSLRRNVPGATGAEEKAMAQAWGQEKAS